MIPAHGVPAVEARACLLCKLASLFETCAARYLSGHDDVSRVLALCIMSHCGDRPDCARFV
jgi:hypothetical protein